MLQQWLYGIIVPFCNISELDIVSQFQSTVFDPLVRQRSICLGLLTKHVEYTEYSTVKPEALRLYVLGEFEHGQGRRL